MTRRVLQVECWGFCIWLQAASWSMGLLTLQSLLAVVRIKGVCFSSSGSAQTAYCPFSEQGTQTDAERDDLGPFSFIYNIVFLKTYTF